MSTIFYGLLAISMIIQTLAIDINCGKWNYYLSKISTGCGCPQAVTLTGHWSAWSEWSACNSPIKCGNCGQKQRTRICSAGGCEGDASEVESCEKKICEFGKENYPGMPCCPGHHLAYSTKDKFFCEAD